MPREVVSQEGKRENKSAAQESSAGRDGGTGRRVIDGRQDCFAVQLRPRQRRPQHLSFPSPLLLPQCCWALSPSVPRWVVTERERERRRGVAYWVRPTGEKGGKKKGSDEASPYEKRKRNLAIKKKVESLELKVSLNAENRGEKVSAGKGKEMEWGAPRALFLAV